MTGPTILSTTVRQGFWDRLLGQKLKEVRKKLGDLTQKTGDMTKVASATEKPAVVIDQEGITGRIVPLPIEAGSLAGLTAGTEGQIYYIRRETGISRRDPAGRGKPSLRRFDLKTREEETLAEGIDGFKLSADRKKILYHASAAEDNPSGAFLRVQWS